MDEKEMIKRIKNSFESGLSRAEITRKMQAKGYKLEYIDVLINRAGYRKKLVLKSLITIIILSLFVSVIYLSYMLFFNQGVYLSLQNPLAGRNISFESRQAQAIEQTNIDDIEVTPEFLNYLLNEIGAYKLHKNPLTGNKAMILFSISDKEFCSEIDKKIQTFEKSCEKEPDIQFIIPKNELVKAMISSNSGNYFKESIKNSNTQVKIIASESRLFAKGYLSIYDNLKSKNP